MRSWRTWLASLYLIPAMVRAQSSGRPDPDSVALAVAVFQTAIVHGQLTAHGGYVPEVPCLATGAGIGSRYGEPDSIVNACRMISIS